MNPNSQIPGLYTLNEHPTKPLKAREEMKQEDVLSRHQTQTKIVGKSWTRSGRMSALAHVKNQKMTEKTKG